MHARADERRGAVRRQDVADSVVTPNMRVDRPAPTRTKPESRNGRASPAWSFGMNRVARKMPRMPTGMLIQNIHRQWK